MSESPSEATTEILQDASLADEERLQRLVPLVYDQLRAAAQAALNHERPDHTLQATALVHEAFLKLAGGRQLPWANRAHFYAAAAEAMRRILLDHARSRNRHKRGGPGQTRVDLEHLTLGGGENIPDFVILDDALRRLETEAPEMAAVVRLRYFAGLDIADTAAALGVSTPTVKRRWVWARAWLYRALGEDDDEGAMREDESDG